MKENGCFRKLKIIPLIFFLLVLTVNKTNAQTLIMDGDSTNQNAQYNWDGENLRKGSDTKGPVIIAWDGSGIRSGDYVKEGKQYRGKVLYNWNGRYLRKGAHSFGKVLYSYDELGICTGNCDEKYAYVYKYSWDGICVRDFKTDKLIRRIVGSVPVAILIYILFILDDGNN